MDKIILATGISLSDWVEFSKGSGNYEKLPLDVVEDSGYNGFIALVKPNISQFKPGITSRFFDESKKIEICLNFRVPISFSDRLGYTTSRKKIYFRPYFSYNIIDDGADFSINISSLPDYIKILKEYCNLTHKYYSQDMFFDRKHRLYDLMRLVSRDLQRSIIATLFRIYEKAGY